MRKAISSYLLFLPATILMLWPIGQKAREINGSDVIDAVYETRTAAIPLPQIEREGMVHIPPVYHSLLSRAVPSRDSVVPKEYTCLAQAIYFEARGEPVEGQLAVAQVVLNRVTSKRYPDTICNVVFQNEHRRHRCQFSFACDGLSDTPHNPVAWKHALDVAGMAIAGKAQDDLTMRATHYHATYVAPYWSEVLTPTVKLGHHIFYRDS